MGSSNITVNGRPVQEFIGEQIGKEIRDVRTADQNVPVHRPAISKRNNSNLSHSRAGAGRSLIEMKGKATHVLIKGELFDWLEKSVYGYTPSGHSIFGLFEVCNETKELKCHHCGEWHLALPSHVSHSTKTDHPSFREYKFTHGLRIKSSSVHPQVALKASLRGKANPAFKGGAVPGRHKQRSNSEAFQLRRQLAGPCKTAQGENANLFLGCQKQTETKLLNYVATLGRRPMWSELEAYVDESGVHSLNPSRLRNIFGVSVRSILQRMELPRARKYMRKRIGPLQHNGNFLSNGWQRTRQINGAI